MGKTGGLNIPGAIMGRYRIAEDVIVCVLHMPRAAPKKTQKYKRKGRKEIDNSYEVPEQDFHLEFFMSGHKWGRLEWKHFDLVSKYTSGRRTWTTFRYGTKTNIQVSCSSMFQVTSSNHLSPWPEASVSLSLEITSIAIWNHYIAFYCYIIKIQFILFSK